jgi:hypothetical protein
LSADGKLWLEFREIGPPLVDHDHLTIDDGFAWYGKRAGNLGEAFGPIQPVASVNFLPAAVEMNLNAISIEFDFMKPLLALGRFGLQCYELGFDEPGI